MAESKLVQLPVLVKTITREQLGDYARASGDFNPLHLDDHYASTTQFGGIIAHGMLTLAFISEMMASTFGPVWLESGTLRVRFKGAARPGEQVEAWGQVTKEEASPSHRLVTCSVGVRNSHTGQELISGTTTVKVV